MLTVHSEVVMEPELMVVTRLRDELGNELDKQHLAVPAAAAEDFLGRGSRALSLFLHSSHLCFVQRLLWSPRKERGAAHSPPRIGVLGTQVFDSEGRVVISMGEDQVSGNWLQISYLLVGLIGIAADSLELGRCQRTVATGKGIAAIVLEGRDADVTISYVDPNEISAEGECGLVEQVEAV